jgi:hypothetical protein
LFLRSSNTSSTSVSSSSLMIAAASALCSHRKFCVGPWAVQAKRPIW